MASFVLLCCIITPIFLLSILILNIFKPSKANKSNLPPGSIGWPLLGESYAFVSFPEGFIRERMAKHSPSVFQTSIAGERMTVLCGPVGNKFLFTSNNTLIKPWWPKAVTKALLFESSPSDMSSLSEDHSFLKADSVQSYVSVVASSARDHVQANWVSNNVVKVHHLAKDFTFGLACRLFLNLYDGQVRDLTEPFFAVAKGIVSAPVNLPGTRFNGAVKGGAVIKERLVQIIRAKKNHEDVKGQDYLLSKLVLACDKDGKFYSEEEIANKIIGYLIASFYTTSNAITFVMSHLADNPDVYDKVLKEHVDIANSKEVGELLSWGDIQRMKYSWNVVCESMRLIPPAQGAFKEVLTDLTFAGFNIPKGWKALWTVHTTNKNPKYFPNPEKFDPSRFEGNGPLPYTFVPFGGGPRMCAGKEYARVAILVLVHNVVTRFGLKKANPNEKIIYDPDPVPVEGLPIRLHPHKI